MYVFLWRSNPVVNIMHKHTHTHNRANIESTPEIPNLIPSTYPQYIHLLRVMSVWTLTQTNTHMRLLPPSDFPPDSIFGRCPSLILASRIHLFYMCAATIIIIIEIRCGWGQCKWRASVIKLASIPCSHILWKRHPQNEQIYYVGENGAILTMWI